MAYEVTATRKRPQVFEKLVGQEFVVSTIANAIAQNRIAHAYLFSGPRGVGKTTSARLLAKALNCKEGPTAQPCGVCDSCREITAGNSIDVIEIDGASNTSVNDIRQIKDEVLFPPQASRYKIYIIDEVHMLSNSAFNALLKTIEEPPEYIIFIFATTELQKVPATIRSRCQQFHFQLIGLEQIKGCLAEAASELGIKADDDALFWIAKEATGSMRDAYTLFDQVAAFSQNHITLQGIKDKLGIVGIERTTALMRLVAGGKGKEAVESLSSMLGQGVSVEQCIKDLADFFRALLLNKEGITSEDLLSYRMEEIPADLVAAYSPEQLETALYALFQMYREIRYSLNPRFELELFILRLQHLSLLTNSTELVEKLHALKDSVTSGKALVITEKSVSPIIMSPVPAPAAPAKEVSTPPLTERKKETEAEVVPAKTEEHAAKAQMQMKAEDLPDGEDDDDDDEGTDEPCKATMIERPSASPIPEVIPQEEDKKKPFTSEDLPTLMVNTKIPFEAQLLLTNIKSCRYESDEHLVFIVDEGGKDKATPAIAHELEIVIKNEFGFAGNLTFETEKKTEEDTHSAELQALAKHFRGSIMETNKR